MVSIFGLLLLSCGSAAWGAGSYVLGGPAIYSRAHITGEPHGYLASAPHLVWWTLMSDYATSDSFGAVATWYQASSCAAAFGAPLRCDLDHYTVFGVDFTRFVILQAGLNNTTSVRLVTMISLWI